MRVNALRNTSIALIASSMMGCLSQTATPEQMQQQREALAMLQQRLSMGMPAQNQQPNPQPKSFALASMTEEEMRSAVSSLPKVAQGVEFKRQRDGFDYNGQRYLDPEGQIVNYAFDWKTGDVTFLVKTAPKQFVLKHTRVTTSAEPINIGIVTSDNGNYLLETVTSKKLSGTQFILSSTGVALSRGDSAFVYTYGQPTKTLITPEGWHIAQFQNGDVMSTGYVLLERNAEKKDSSGLGGLFNSMSELGNIVGLNEKNDYALMSIDDPSQQHLINVTLGGKDVEVGASGCRQTSNKYINKCDSFEFADSVYQRDGRRNQTHYFWGIRWFATMQGPIAVAHEAGGKKVSVIDLSSGKKATAFERMLGINEYDAIQDANGQIHLRATLGFASEEIEDVRTWLQSAPAISNEEKS